MFRKAKQKIQRPIFLVHLEGIPEKADLISTWAGPNGIWIAAEDKLLPRLRMKPEDALNFAIELKRVAQNDIDRRNYEIMW